VGVGVGIKELRNRIVIGASAGGIDALIRLVRALPLEMASSIFIAVHYPAHGVSMLPKILSRNSMLTAIHPANGESVRPGTIYVAPPDRHMVFEDNKIVLTKGPREHGFRPAIDPLFRSAARLFGERVVGIILSGTLGDGAAGLQAIKKAGGLALVQDPSEAIFSGMPTRAIEEGEVDAVLTLGEIAKSISELVSAQVSQEEIRTMTSAKKKRAEIDQPAKYVRKDMQRFEQGAQSHATSLTCPDCGGSIWEVGNGNNTQYRCHVGHIYSIESMLSGQGNTLESALWTAVRLLEERAALLKRLASRAGLRSSPILECRFAKQAQENEVKADVIRQMLLAQDQAEGGLEVNPFNEP
jgi:two-component system, chemotaxis family, protein-glutamate methylesterase/glutaminase